MSALNRALDLLVAVFILAGVLVREVVTIARWPLGAAGLTVCLCLPWFIPTAGTPALFTGVGLLIAAVYGACNSSVELSWANLSPEQFHNRAKNGGEIHATGYAHKMRVLRRKAVVEAFRASGFRPALRVAFTYA